MIDEAVSAGVGTAHLSSELDDDGSYTISGVALGAGDVTVGSSGIKKKWPGEELRRAASTLEGKPLVRDHENNTDGRVGTVTEAYYRDGVGVMYEAEIAPHYDQLAQDIASGIQEVSARAYHNPVEDLEETDEGALSVENVVFDNLSVVSQGASPSNSVHMGGFDQNPVAMAEGPSGGAVATLSTNGRRPESGVDELAEYSRGDWVEWSTRNSTEIGTVTGSYQEGDDIPDIRGDRGLDPEDGEVLYTLRMYKERDGTYHPIEGKPIGHYEDSVRSAEEPSDVSESAVELGRSNHDQYDVEEEDWVQWYPSDTTEEHGFATSVDGDTVTIEVWTQNADGEWETDGETITKSMEAVEPWGNFPRKQDDFADAIDGEDPRRAVKPSEEENASSSELVSSAVEDGLKEKVEEHNEEHGDEDGKRVTYRMLKNVFERGMGAYQDSHREGMTPQQWSYARVNAFLYLVRNGNPENDAYVQDNDLLPDDHPKAGETEDDSEENTAMISDYDDQIVAELMEDDLDAVYTDWSDAVNMSASELDTWSDHPCSNEASLDPDAVRERNMMLLETDKSDWGEDEMEAAKRTISFISRMSSEEMKPDDPMGGSNECPSEWAISLMNWAYNPFDTIPDVPEDMTEENMMNKEINYDAVNGAVWFETPDRMDAVTTPVEFVVGCHDFNIVDPDQPAREGYGHIHVLVNQNFLTPGEQIPIDEDGYHHMTEKKFELELPPGEHTLRLQAADSNHRAYDMVDEISIEVFDPDAEENSMHGHSSGDNEDTDADMQYTSDHDDVYSDESDAMDRADEIGCDTTHSMEIDGEMMHMPCNSHDAYENAIESMMAAHDIDTVEELAEINDMDVNGLVMFDGNMGAISGFEMKDGSLMVELDLIEQEDGSFTKTGETVMRSMADVAEESPSITTASVSELESSWHMVDFDGMDDEREWSRPNMEDFDTDDMSEISDHFLVSKTGEFPPENYGDLALPVVWPNGDLSLEGLDSAHQTAGAVDGVSDDMAEKLQRVINDMAEEHFDQPVAGEEMSATIVSTDNDPYQASTVDTAALESAPTAILSNTTMTNITYENATEDAIEEMSNPVVMEESDVESLSEKASDAEEISERLDELASNQDVLDEVDQDTLDELREYDEAVVLTQSEHEELQGLVDDIGTVFAEELADHSAFDAGELQERFSPLELRDKVESHDDASVTEDLGASETDPEPEGGTADPDELEQSDAEAVEEMTEDSLREKVAESLEDARMDRQAEKVRSGDISLDEMGIDPSNVLAD